ncbi:MAG: hypothetical protein C4533_02420 [Candidatus Omnitrophota bacterium]|jgi:hypothetical protein|nr:MAG: hypothetical protein C4533_02420 [Candidatus Omnitrophota bacterium]
MKTMSQEEKIQRVVTFLNRQEVDFLDKVGKDALFSTGAKLSRARLISWLVDLVEHLDISGQGIKSEKDFENRILNAFKKQEGSVLTCHGRTNQGGAK